MRFSGPAAEAAAVPGGLLGAVCDCAYGERQGITSAALSMIAALSRVRTFCIRRAILQQVVSIITLSRCAIAFQELQKSGWVARSKAIS
jgi:cell shape-determining protein MreD